MEHLHNYNDNFYCLLEDSEEDTGPWPGRGPAPQVDGTICEGARCLDDSKNQRGNLSQGGHLSPYNYPGLEDDQSTREPLELRPEKPGPSLSEVPRRHSRRRQLPFHFTLWQVQEMETVFQETQYPDVLTRRVLARNMNAPEAKVQNWFNNRRAKQRAYEKKTMLRRSLPGIQDHICMMDPEEA
ncbi:homeobox protein Rhox13-like [Mesocricetus auratus]|uniref:Homeobox protein Rhox13-like n=1 Tax=Mesocricetus auratus TaxID=10036 RepID=A0ABM2XA56_MESAU|nr:homeobox protein Rhox13-like [Mesocricetus auratus]